MNSENKPTTLINKGFELAEKNATKRITEPEKAQQRETPSIRCNLQQKQPRTIHRNDKNLKLKNKDKIKEILDIRKIIKSQR